MTTFTDPDDTAAPASPDTPVGEEPTEEEVGNDKLRVKVKLTSINLILNEDGFRLATLSLSAGDVSVMLRSPTMRIAARLGNLTFVDDFSADEPKEMLSIQGDEVADLQYETFDPTELATYPGYDTSVYLRSGSFKFTFSEEPVHRILVFFSKFARMKAVYDAATAAAAQRATEVQTMIPKMHYDIVISTPIVVFPRDASESKDIVTANLGEISVRNEFEVSDDRVVTKISAGLSKVRLTTTIYTGGTANDLQILDDVQLGADMVLTQSANPGQEIDTPATLVSCF
jgi:vacuolar protein sorting-associated protein 13A/C